MEEWIKFIAPLIGIAGLWWKLTTSMATKAELNAMRSDMSDMKADLKAEIAEVKSGMADIKADLKAEIAEVKSGMADMKVDFKEDIAEVKAGMVALKADFKTENAELRADIREIRQLLYKNVVDTGGKGDNKDVDGN